ncbi:PIN domain-containing protein [Iningainema tapete]|uniref:Type II toxin-antitoxin system VapC family toxin n=1 Tax=Iningainema tapete BLCC-T55 TaxID=2748662 RepID=A0A8J6XU62_9CYAN|nr:type II toxin-antitoxin system VapC family toxin [Iningainema tapete BLCC-T55]
MKGLDTNILVRYIVQDDPVQGEKVSQFIEQTVAEGENNCFINNIVLCEFVWVLESAYSYTKEEIADALEKILRTSMFDFESKDAAWWSLREYRKSKADFSDCLIARVNKTKGCQQTVSFDKGVRGVDGFTVL